VVFPHHCWSLQAADIQSAYLNQPFVISSMDGQLCGNLVLLGGAGRCSRRAMAVDLLLAPFLPGRPVQPRRLSSIAPGSVFRVRLELYIVRRVEMVDRNRPITPWRSGRRD
jgi:hypothetical protein